GSRHGAEARDQQHGHVRGIGRRYQGARQESQQEGERMNFGNAGGGMGGIDPQMLQMMMMQMQGGGGMGGGMGQQPMQPPPPMQPAPAPVTANRGLPSMAQPQQFQQTPLAQNFDQNMQGMQGPNWWQQNKGNFGNAGMALM